MLKEEKTLKAECKPFLRWAGGKRWLLKNLHNFLPLEKINQYHEPFLGGGSIFFNIQPKKAYISDLNIELINTYKAIKSHPEEVIKYLKIFKNTKEDYLKIRKQKFQLTAKKAAQFIYLNQMSFNGIYRVNLKGEYNVPYGYRENYKFDYTNIRAVSRVLQTINIEAYDFSQCLDNIEKNDLVFLDPPYTVTHNNNGFVQYNQKIFSLEDQYKLSDLIKKIKEKEAYYILTNANHPKIKEIFDFNDKVFILERASLIGGKNAVRGKYSEILMTNGRI